MPQCPGTECIETGEGDGWGESSKGWFSFLGGLQVQQKLEEVVQSRVGSQSHRFAEFWAIGFNPGRTQDLCVTPSASLAHWGENQCVLLLCLFLVFGPFSSSCSSLLQPLPVPAVCRCWRGIENLCFSSVLLKSLSMTNLCL